MYISLNIALWFHILCSLKSSSWSSFDAVVFQFEWLLLNFPPKLGSCQYLAHRLFLLDFLGPAPKSGMTSGGTSSAHCCSCHADLKHSVCFWEPHASSALPTVAFFSVLTLLLEAVRFHASEETGTPADSSQASQGSWLFTVSPIWANLWTCLLIIKMGIEVPLLPKVKWDHVRVQTAMSESPLCKNYFLWKHWFLLKHLGGRLLPPSSQNCFSLSELFFVTD